jgi:exopolyphosphatase/guanosine-5'-triphosphate,3'-diphosphate pyrophosphatase
LGSEAFLKKEIHTKTMKKIILLFKKIQEDCRKNKVETIYAVGTSAMRTVKNSDKLVKKINKETSINLNILSGNDEASLLKYLNCKNYKKTKTIIIDIGGGSTEIFFSDFQGNEFMKSFKLGAVRLYEKKDKLSEWSKLNNFLDSIPKQNITRLVGVGGNVRSIVKINNNKEFVTLNELQIIHKTLSTMSIKDKIKYFNLSEDRADIIDFAALIYIKILEKFENINLFSSSWNLSDGMVLQNIYSIDKKAAN